MTRINIIHPVDLTDQHLFAEFRELKMVPQSLKRSLYTKSIDEVVLSIPSVFTLGHGHVKFFYDKGLYLEKRYALIRMELFRRGVNFNAERKLNPDGLYDIPGIESAFRKDWTPTPESVRIIRHRLHERIMMKPDWYRYYNEPLTELPDANQNRLMHMEIK